MSEFFNYNEMIVKMWENVCVSHPGHPKTPESLIYQTSGVWRFIDTLILIHGYEF